ncbi:MAG: hypothetical protein K2L80_04040, partial [Muribaculaceae bacterium]|nr:hypothetical protein [Muribaculaceae bacterium]
CRVRAGRYIFVTAATPPPLAGRSIVQIQAFGIFYKTNRKIYICIIQKKFLTLQRLLIPHCLTETDIGQSKSNYSNKRV